MRCRKKVSAQRYTPALVRAFKDAKSKGVVLLINSPGGSPVQAHLLRERLVSLRAEHPEKKTVTVAEDQLTSAAYLVATGTEQIYVNRSTIAGSIGVIMSGFGFDGLIKRLDIERRVFTPGERKLFMDPFKALNKDDLSKASSLLTDIHRHFIEAVIEGRGERLKGDRKALFSGEFWVGEKAVELGLADGLNDLPGVLKTVFGVQYTRDYTPAQNLLERLSERVPGLAQQIIGGLASDYALR
jgi:protease-4